MVQQTSLFAYAEIKKNGTVGKKQQAVYECLEKWGPMSNQEISKALNWPINTVTPRVKELREKKMIRYVRTEISEQGRPVMLWDIKAGDR